MKKYSILITYLCLAITSQASGYELFNENTKKLFTNLPDRNLSYSIRFDSIVISGEDTWYYNFSNVSYDTMFTIECTSFYNENYCYKQNLPSWLGAYVVSKPDNIYDFITNSGTEIQFIFTTDTSNPHVFYEDSNQVFSILFETTDTITFLGIADSARFYRISHTTSNGVPIESLLHNHQIIIGNDLGLISFIKIDKFPIELIPFELIGNTNPDAGLIALTHEMVFDHQPGDIIQRKSGSSSNSGYPPDNSYTHTRHTFLSRTDLVDSVIYNVARYRIYSLSGDIVYDTIQLSYRRSNIIALIPFEWTDPADGLEYKNSLHKQDFCGLQLWNYKIDKKLRDYCLEDNCWNDMSYFGSVFEYRKQIVVGLGLYSEFTSYYPPGNDWLVDYNSLNYFKKDGIECGTMVDLPQNDEKVIKHLKVFPNPTATHAWLQLPENLSLTQAHIELYSTTGRLLYKANPTSQFHRIEVAHLPKGLYLVRLWDGKRWYAEKVLVQ